ncbi:MAG TPA: tetratricopeptide repeat protein [Opitutaceae bacterium]|jgi:tetratricopeptide (TPR) repeat protein
MPEERQKQQAPPTQPPRLPVILAALAVAASICAAYWTSFSGVLVFDDGAALRDNPTIRTLWPLSTPLSPPAGTTLGSRPVANLSFALNHALTGDAVWGYHAGNLVIHVLCALLILGIVRRTLALRYGRTGPGRDSLGIACAVALLWGVHPLATEAVTYVVQRVESLMALFVLLALYSFIRAAEGGSRATWLPLSSAACLLGAGTKEVAAVAPVLILTYDALFISGSAGAALRGRRLYYLSLTSGWLLLLALGASGGWSRAGSAGFGAHVPATGYWLTQAVAVCRYLRLALWPAPLVFDYGTYLVPSALGALPYLLVVVALLAATAVALARRRPLGYGGAWFFVLLAPTSLVPVATQTMAEHRAYLSLAAVVLCLVLAVHRLAGGGWKSWVPLGAAAFVLATVTEGRNSLYGSEAGLWGAAARDWPGNARAHCSLGLAYSRQPGGTARAIAEYREAIRLHENYSDAHTDLGAALMQTPGTLGAAVGEFERSIQIRPGSADAHNDLGRALEETGRVDRAAHEYEEALRLRPSYPDAECNLGILLMRQGQEKEAAAHLTRAADMEPSNARAEFFLAGILGQEGLTQESIRRLREVVQLKPGFAEAHSTLGMALFRSGNTAEGLAEIERAIQLKPGLVQARLIHAAALLQLGRSAEGKAELERVLELQPGNPAATQMLGELANQR